MGLEIEAVILTGGASHRMGRDKSMIQVDGRSLAERTAAEFDSAGVPVTVLGLEELPGRAFLQDAESFAGPAVSLSRFTPSCPIVFIASCDMPRFLGKHVHLIANSIGGREAAIPIIGSKEQYLCAAYRESVFEEWKYLVESGGKRSMRELVRTIDCKYLEERDLEMLGIEPIRLTGVNTPEELESLLGSTPDEG